MTPQRVEEVLTNWARWMRHSRSPGQLSGRAASGIIAASHQDFDAMCADMDMAVARATDAILDDLEPPPRAAVYAIELGCTWLYVGDPDEQYLVAVAILARRLDQIGIT